MILHAVVFHKYIMNLKELNSFRLDDAVKFHDELNDKLFDQDERMYSDVRLRLLEISADFIEHLGIHNLDIIDITVSGSNAAYSYTDHSDIDLHIVVDTSEIENDDVYQELFTAKKLDFNKTHDIKIHGYDVEMYVQDSSQKHVSLGEYSVLHDKWNNIPVKRRSHFDETATKLKFEKLVQLSELALNSDNIHLVNTTLDIIKKYRRAGLDQHGEFGPENLAYKALRTSGIVQDLFDHRDRIHSNNFDLT